MEAVHALVAGMVPLPPVLLVQPLLGLAVGVEAVGGLAPDIVLRTETRAHIIRFAITCATESAKERNISIGLFPDLLYRNVKLPF